MKTTYTKLKKEDAWGIRIQGEAHEIEALNDGMSIEVSKKDESQQTETIAKVLVKRPDEGYALASIVR